MYLCYEWSLVLGFTAWILLRAYVDIRPTEESTLLLTSPDLQRLDASLSDSFIGELHVAAIWTAHVTTDGEGWPHFQVLQVPEKEFQ